MGSSVKIGLNPGILATAQDLMEVMELSDPPFPYW